MVFATVGEMHFAGLRLLVPDWSTLNVFSLILTVGALIAMLRFKAGMIQTLATTAMFGVIYVYAVG